MSDIPVLIAVEQEDESIHVGYHDPDVFEKIRPPEWVDNVSNSVVEGSDVQMGTVVDADD